MEHRELRIVERQKRLRAPVEVQGLGHVQALGSLPGHAEGAGCPGPKLVARVSACGRGQLERILIVVGEELRLVGDPLADRRLDPGGHREVLGCPLRPRDLSVGYVAHEGMPERVLGLVLDRARADRAHQLLPREVVERLAGQALPDASHGGDRARPEDLPDHRGVLQEALAIDRQGVQPRADEGLHGLGDGHPALVGDRSECRPVALEDPPVGEHPDELLRVERIAPGPFEKLGHDLRRQHRLLQERREQPGGVRLGERGERDRGRVALPTAPSGVALVELGARGTDDEQGNPARPLDEVLDELDQRTVGPVKVLEDEDERVARGDGLQEPHPRGERLVATVSLRLRPAHPDERGQAAPEPVALGLVLAHGGHGRLELLEGEPGRIRLEDPRLRLDHLAQRPVRHPLAIGQASSLAPEDELRAIVEVAAELPQEARLADPGLTGDRHELDRGLGDGPGERLGEERELVLPADEGRPSPLVDVDAEPAAGRQRAPDLHGLGLALDHDRLERLVLDPVPGGSECHLPHDDAVHGRHGLKARRGVDDVAGDDALALLGTRPERDDGLAGVRRRFGPRGRAPAARRSSRRSSR